MCLNQQDLNRMFTKLFWQGELIKTVMTNIITSITA